MQYVRVLVQAFCYSVLFCTSRDVCIIMTTTVALVGQSDGVDECKLMSKQIVESKPGFDLIYLY